MNKQTFMTALRDGKFKSQPGKGWVFEWHHGDDLYECVFEPITISQIFYVALYKNGELLTERVPVKPALIDGDKDRRTIREIRGNITKLKKEMS
jgi:hypothetical protein